MGALPTQLGTRAGLRCCFKGTKTLWTPGPGQPQVSAACSDSGQRITIQHLGAVKIEGLEGKQEQPRTCPSGLSQYGVLRQLHPGGPEKAARLCHSERAASS